MKEDGEGVNPTLLFHDFEIEMSGIKIEQIANGKLRVHGLIANGTKLDLKQDGIPELVWEDGENKSSVLVLDQKDITSVFKRLVKETDFGEKAVTKTRITTALTNEFKTPANQEKRLAQDPELLDLEKLKDVKFSEWILRNECINHYKGMQPERYSPVRNLQIMYDVKIGDDKFLFEEVHAQRATNVFPEKYYKNSATNIYSRLANIFKAGVGTEKQAPVVKVLVDRLVDPQDFGVSEAARDAVKNHQKVFREFLDGTFEHAGKKHKMSDCLSQVLSSSASDMPDHIKAMNLDPEKVKAVVKNYCVVQSKSLENNETPSPANIKILSIAVKQGLVDETVMAKIIKVEPQVLSKLETSLNSIDPEHAAEKLTAIKRAMKSPNIQREASPKITKTSVRDLSLKSSEFDELPSEPFVVPQAEAQASRPLTEFDSVKENIRDKIADYYLSKSGFGDEMPSPYPSIAQSLRKFDVVKIVEIVKEMDPASAASVILHLGDQKKSQDLLTALPNKQFGEVIAAKNFENPFTKEEL
jgi:hypothetical protein